MPRITIVLKDDEKQALCALAENEFRDPRAQAALIIRREIERQGLIKPVSAAPVSRSQGQEPPLTDQSTHPENENDTGNGPGKTKKQTRAIRFSRFTTQEIKL
jgi:hypothetical protein